MEMHTEDTTLYTTCRSITLLIWFMCKECVPSFSSRLRLPCMSTRVRVHACMDGFHPVIHRMLEAISFLNGKTTACALRHQSLDEASFPNYRGCIRNY
eukprot:scaffold42029_cov145-Amphora_coffeaeformis.AAC.2